MAKRPYGESWLVDKNDIIKRAKEIKKGLNVNPMYEQIGLAAEDFIGSGASAGTYLKSEFKGLKNQVRNAVSNPRHSLGGLLGFYASQRLEDYAPKGVYVNPTMKRLGYKTEEGSKFYFEEPKQNELFRIGGEINF